MDDKYSCFFTDHCWPKRKNYSEHPLLPQPAPLIDVVDSGEIDDILIIKDIEACLTTNCLRHKTDMYKLCQEEYDSHLIVRRGQQFDLKLLLNREYEKKTDKISFIFTAEDIQKPSYGRGTMAAVSLTNKYEENLLWNVILKTKTTKSLTLNVSTHPEIAVAKWKLEIDVKNEKNHSYSYSWEKYIYVLFNPWNIKDSVYMKSEKWRNETVLNEIGLIWRGNFTNPNPVLWKYNQFEKNVLDCALYLLIKIAKLKAIHRGDPIRVSRALTAAVNSDDDNGVIIGNWTENFSDGVSPTRWLGSSEIIDRYYNRKIPVKFGQCWVFAGVLTTVCRALGLPSRPITNFSSAHDTQGSLTVDYFVDKNGDLLDYMNNDSVWNFHVWNEIWMSRPDLGTRYSGWQVVDATPQEVSENMYRVGPSSVQAVKEGKVMLPYDNKFVYAEVNADKVFWRYIDYTKPLKYLGKESNSIGKLVCTKSADSFDLLDITNCYKFQEESVQEKNAMLIALQQAGNSFSRYYLNEHFEDIQFYFRLNNDIEIGQAFCVSVEMKNKNLVETYRVSLVLRVDSMTYTGDIRKLIKSQNFDIFVKPDSVHEAALDIYYDHYKKHILEQGDFQISCLANVEGTNFEYYAQEHFRILKPEIEINFGGKPVVNQCVLVDLFLQNPLPVRLQQGAFKIEAPGFEKPLILKIKKSVGPRKPVKATFDFCAKIPGLYSITVNFTSKEIKDCSSHLLFTVEES